MRQRVIPPQIRTTPRARRKQRQTTQQTRCCGCLLLLIVSMVVLGLMAGRIGDWWREQRQRRAEAASYHFPLELEVEGRHFLRYQLVPIVLRIQDPEGQPVVSTSPPRITVFYEGDPVVTVGRVEKLGPRYRLQSKDYICHWPIPWMAKAGEYLIQARVKLEDPTQWRWAKATSEEKVLPSEEAVAPPQGDTYCTAQATIFVERRELPPFPPGTCIATWEADFPQGPVRLPSGGKGDWRAMIAWCEFMGADTLLFRGAVTSTSRGPLGAEQPFVSHNLEAIPRLGAEAHRHDLKFGVWAMAYATLPTNTNVGKPPYDYAQDISRRTGNISSKDFISLLDEQRVKDLAEFCRQMQAEPTVDLVGLDYMRSSEVGGYEVTNLFTSEMPVKLPSNWDQLSQKQRWKYVARKVEVDYTTPAGRDFYEQWNWWRAHRGAEIVDRIIRDSELKKPFFLFVFSWMHGRQSGQDPPMFTDARTSLLLPMLYQMPDQQRFEYTMRQWNDYMRPGQVNLAPGDQVDDFWHQRSRDPVASPELLYQRMREGHRRMIFEGQPVGAFWHDISRAAVKGNLGPYPGTEWALAGAAAFSQVRQSWRVYPLKFTFSCPKRVRFGIPFRIRVTIENLCATKIKDIVLRLENTVKVKVSGQGRKLIAALGPGEKLEVPLDVVVTGPSPARHDRFMVCVRAEWPPRDYGETFRSDLPTTFVLMQYVKATATGG